MARAVSGVQAPFSGMGRLIGGLALGALALGLVAGCGDTADDSGATRAASSAGLSAAGSRVIERDVEAPDIFSMEEKGLWDGRPSLGGVWVAHPQATDPERVMIRNEQTGETVVGALFRRERDNPGPRFQISSEAANSLDILPGQPTTIRVVALQLQRIEPEPEPEKEEAPPVANADAEPGDAASALPAAEAEAETEEDTGAQAVAAAEATMQAEEPERQRGLGRLFSRRSSAPASEIDSATDSATDMATEPGAAAPPDPAAPGSDIAVAPLPEPGAAPVERGLDEPEIAAPAQAQAPEPERRGLRRLFSRGSDDRAAESPEPQQAALIPIPEDAPEPRAEAAQRESTSALDRGFVQIGIFSVEDNATAARERMQRAGLDAEIRRGQMNDNRFWRVVVGPARDSAGRAAMLDKVREMGFGDAYAVAR